MSGRAWTAAEDEILQAMVGEHGSAAIAKRLGVSTNRVNNRIARLGLSRKQLNVFSANELAQILGLEGNWIRHSLLATGILPHRRLPGRGRWGLTQVTEDDLIAFLRDHPHLIDRQKVEPAYRQYVPERWITLGEVFRRGGAHVTTMEHVYEAGFLPQARRRGLRIVVPEAMLPELVERRRARTDDVENKRQYRVYAAMQRKSKVARRRQWHEARKSA